MKNLAQPGPVLVEHMHRNGSINCIIIDLSLSYRRKHLKESKRHNFFHDLLFLGTLFLGNRNKFTDNRKSWYGCCATGDSHANSWAELQLYFVQGHETVHGYISYVRHL